MIGLLGISHKTATLKVREKFKISILWISVEM
jgi:glutamyl-tRNA reductase